MTGFLASGLMVLAGFVATPFLLGWLGDERLGAFRAAGDWFGYVTLLDLGLSGALLPLFAAALGKGSWGEARAVLRAGIRAYTAVAVLTFFAAVVLALAMPFLVPVSASMTTDLQRGCWVWLVGVPFVSLTPFQALAEAGQKSYLVNGLILGQCLLVTACGLFLAWADWGITGQFVALVLGKQLFALGLIVAGIRSLSILWSAPPDPVALAHAQRELWKLHWPTLAFSVCGRISLLSDNIIVALALGPFLVVPFFLTQRLPLLVQGQLQALGNASWAALAELHAQGKSDIFRQRLIELTQWSSILAIALLAPVAAYNEYFVQLWIGSHRYAGDGITVLAAVCAFLQTLFSLWGWVFSGTGQVARLLKIFVVATVVNLIGSLIGTWTLGMVGPLLGTLGAFVFVVSWSLPWLLCRVFSVPLWALSQAAIFPLYIGIPYGSAVWWLAHGHTPWGWLGLAAEMVLAACGYLGLCWCLLFNAGERRQWLERWRFLFAR